jgi:hypothetical protein
MHSHILDVKCYIKMKERNFTHEYAIYVMGPAMVHVVTSRYLTTEDRVRSRVSPCGLTCGEQNDTGTGYSTSFCFSASIIPLGLHTHISGI